MSEQSGTGGGASGNGDKVLFLGCFMALIATAFGFIIRAQIIGDWEADFNLSESEKGQIIGVGLWPFAVSIVIFSLIIDKIGYGKAMVFGFVCHTSSVALTILAGQSDPGNFRLLYLGTFIAALGNGTIEAVINPVVATMFAKDKTKWLNILHAGWPGGLVFGGLLVIAMNNFGWEAWQPKVALVLIPTILYGILLFGRHFPVQERVEAGISFKDMLREAGVVSAAIVIILMVREIGNFFGIGDWPQIGAMAVIIVAYAAFVRSVGRPMFIFLVLIMIPLATTELGTDGWIIDLLTPAMEEFGRDATWVLVYTSFIMFVLRFFAGPIVHRLSPLGLLATSAAVAAVGLAFLSKAEVGIAIFVAATIYGFGKSFFWPTMLGVVSEQFPKGGALTLNLIAGVGMMGVGIVGSVFLGNIQDKEVDRILEDAHPALHAQVMSEEKMSVFGKYRSLDQEKVASLEDADQTTVGDLQAGAKKGALLTVAVFPCIMFVCYMILIFYFRSIGGYRAVELGDHNA